MELMPTMQPNTPTRDDPVANRFGESTSECQAIGKPVIIVEKLLKYSK
jgi:hypothetical protein